MTDGTKTTRTHHFLAAYQPLPPDLECQIWDRVHRAGFSGDDPTSIMIAHDTIVEARLAKSDILYDGLPKRAAQAVKHAMGGMIAEYISVQNRQNTKIASQVVDATLKALMQRLPTLERTLQWRGIVQFIFAFTLIAVLLVGAGYVVGRSETRGLETGYAGLANQPDAKTWQMLQRLNPSVDDFIATLCRPGQAGYQKTESGRDACVFTFFIDAPSLASSSGFLSTLRKHLMSIRASMPFEIIFAFGVLAGLAMTPFVKKGKTNPW